MARTKQTSKPQGKPLMSWTRFRLPPNYEWPNWPWLGVAGGDGGESEPVNPLSAVPGAFWHALGRMVEDPQEGACLIKWEFMDDLTNFIASPACDDVLRLLDGKQQQDDTGDDLDPLVDEAAAAAEPPAQTEDTPAENNERELLIAYRRSRFLVIRHSTEAATSDIKGRVTLSSFVMGVADDSFDTLYRTYQDAKETFGRPHNIGISGVWFHTPKSWSRADEHEDMSEMWLEKMFGRESGRGGGSAQPTHPVQGSAGAGTSTNASAPPNKAFMCEFNVWNDFRDESTNLPWEEENANNPEAKARWDRKTGEWISDGRILYCKRERWDFAQLRGVHVMR